MAPSSGSNTGTPTATAASSTAGTTTISDGAKAGAAVAIFVGAVGGAALYRKFMAGGFTPDSTAAATSAAEATSKVHDAQEANGTDAPAPVGKKKGKKGKKKTDKEFEIAEGTHNAFETPRQSEDLEAPSRDEVEDNTKKNKKHEMKVSLLSDGFQVNHLDASAAFG